MPPHFWADLAPFRWLILFAFIDPVAVAIGLWMGWNANQAGKLILAGFAAGLAGTAMSFVGAAGGERCGADGQSTGTRLQTSAVESDSQDPALRLRRPSRR